MNARFSLRSMKNRGVFSPFGKCMKIDAFLEIRT